MRVAPGSPWEIENSYAPQVKGHSQGKIFIKHAFEMDVISRQQIVVDGTGEEM